MLCHRGQLFDLDERRCDGPIDGECCRCVPASAGLGGSAYRSAQLLRALPGASAASHAASRIVDRCAQAGDDQTSRKRVSPHARCPLESGCRPRAIGRRLRTGSLRAACLHRRMSGAGTSGSDSPPFLRTFAIRCSPLRVGFVGSFIPTKAPHLLIEAARMLPRGIRDASIWPARSASYHGDDSYRTAAGAAACLIPLSVVTVPFHTIGCPSISAASTFWCCRPSGSRTRRSSSRKPSPRAARRRLPTLAEWQSRCARESTASVRARERRRVGVAAPSAPDGAWAARAPASGHPAADDDRAGRRRAAMPLLGI